MGDYILNRPSVSEWVFQVTISGGETSGEIKHSLRGCISHIRAVTGLSNYEVTFDEETIRIHTKDPIDFGEVGVVKLYVFVDESCDGTSDDSSFSHVPSEDSEPADG